jgi:uncharacterized protein YdeI (YjbR/CyaY-like superfamily)
MPEVRDVLRPASRAAWRAWLAAHHDRAAEVWLRVHRKTDPGPGVGYLPAVLEALCFGWIDGIAKTHGGELVQRFTPRRPCGNWTELNKERARRLIALGQMTPAGARALPDLDPAAFGIPPTIAAALRADPAVWARFEALPPLYQRVRVSNVAELLRRDPAEAARRLDKLVQETAAGRMYGAWQDPDEAFTEGTAADGAPADGAPADGDGGPA